MFSELFVSLVYRSVLWKKTTYEKYNIHQHISSFVIVSEIIVLIIQLKIMLQMNEGRFNSFVFKTK